MNTLTRMVGIGLIIIVLLTPPAMALNKAEILSDIQSRSGSPSLLDFVRGEVTSNILDRISDTTITDEEESHSELRLSVHYSRSETPLPSDRIDLGDLPAPGITSPPYVPVGEVEYIQGLYIYSGECYAIAEDDAGIRFVFDEPVHWSTIYV